MASKFTGIGTSAELIESVRCKAEQASQLLEFMGPEPAPPEDLFDRLIVSLERRRAAVGLELKNWQQRRNRLREAVLQASEAEQLTISELCRMEANLDAAIETCADGKPPGFWDSSDVKEKFDQLLQVLKIKWESAHAFNERSSGFDLEVSGADSEKLSASIDDSRLPEVTDSSFSAFAENSSSVCSSLQDNEMLGSRETASMASDVSSNCLVNATEEKCQLDKAAVFLQLENVSSVSSVAFCWESYFCVDHLRQKVCQRTLNGKILPAETNESSPGPWTSMKGTSQPMSLIPHVVRPCTSKSCLLILDHHNCKVVLTNRDGTSCLIIGPRFSVNYDLKSPEDAIEAGDVLAIVSTKHGLYLVSLSRSKDCKASLSKQSLRLLSPARLAWDSEKRLLVVLDKVATATYKIFLFKISVSLMTISLVPTPGNFSIELTSACTPSVIAHSGRVIVCLQSAAGSSELTSLPLVSNLRSSEKRQLSLGAGHSKTVPVVDICWLNDRASIAVCYADGFVEVVDRASLL